MKTNTKYNKDTARNYRREYLDMMSEVERRRCEYFRMMREIHTAENEVIEDMYRTIETLMAAKGGRFPSAAEITRAMGGRMTRHEVVGQLTVALGEHYNGCGKTSRATHEPTDRRIGKVRREYVRTRTTFAEVDKAGNLVDGGKIMTVEQTVKTYGV